MTWIRKIYTNNTKWKKILNIMCPEINLLDIHGPKKFVTRKLNNFWKDVFLSYANFVKGITLHSYQEVLAEPLFYNDKFQIAKDAFYFKNWENKGIHLVRDLMDEKGEFLDYKRFVEKYGLKVNYLEYIGCIRAVKSYVKENNIIIEGRETNERTKALQTIVNTPKGTKVYYNVLLEHLIIFDIHSFAKWERNLSFAVDWDKTLKQVRKIKEIKIRWFQIRLCHNILVTNSILKKMGIENSDKCSFCRKEKDSIQHYLWDCEFVQNFWRNLEGLIREKCENCARMKLHTELVLFGNDERTHTDEVFDRIILYAKYFVYKCRINKIKPYTQHFLTELRYNYKTEEYMYYMEMKRNEFHIKWFPYQKLLGNED